MGLFLQQPRLGAKDEVILEILQVLLYSVVVGYSILFKGKLLRGRLSCEQFSNIKR